MASYKSKQTNRKIIAGVVAAATVVSLYGACYYTINKEVNPTQVLVATHNLPGGTKISPSDVAVVTQAGSAIGQGVVRDGSVIGKYVQPGGFVHQGSVFYADEVSTSDQLPSGDLYKVPPGEKLYPIPTNLLSSLAGEIQPGTYVDLWFTGKTPVQQGQQQKLVVGPLFKQVYVVDMRNSQANSTSPQQAQQEQIESNGGASNTNQNQSTNNNNNNGGKIPSIMLLLLTKAQVDYIVAAQSMNGQILPVGNSMQAPSVASGSDSVDNLPSVTDFIKTYVDNLPAQVELTGPAPSADLKQAVNSQPQTSVTTKSSTLPATQGAQTTPATQAAQTPATPSSSTKTNPFSGSAPTQTN